MRNTLRGTATVIAGAAAMSGSLLFTGVAQGAVGGTGSPAVSSAGPHGCVQIRPLGHNNGVQATNVSCGRTVQVQVIWSTPPNSRYYAIAQGGKRDYYPHFSWQSYSTYDVV
ncbi:hypothetical protein [Actinomadura oligospora]|uniref:hypothetical protein n=1 Tax=Actinomadura oligospora TaxID=111804 RepID=UPI000478A6AF|nr:hypothetical protein [Actinomadura oligospora]